MVAKGPGTSARGVGASSAHACEEVEGGGTRRTLPPSVDIVPLCPTDFKARLEAHDVFGEVARFATPANVRELFENVSLPAMFQLLEANTMRIWFSLHHTFLV